MDELEIGQVEEWTHERVSSRSAPPAYELTGSRSQLREMGRVGPAADVLRESGLEVLEFDERSGAASFTIPGESSRMFAEYGGYGDRLLWICEEIDAREYYWTEPSEGESSVSAIRSGLREDDLPVIGPGGGVLLTSGADRFYCDLTIRSRFEPRFPEGWRQPLFDPRVWALEEIDVRVFGSLGYFEASGREVQELLRPVFMFVIEHEADLERESDVGWRRLIVEPATELADLPPTAGIEQWYEPEGELR